MRATSPMPKPLASSCRARAICLGSAPGRPRRLRTDARLGREVPVELDPGLDGAEARIHALPDHVTLELEKGARHVEEELAGGGGRVEVLLVEVEIDLDGFEILEVRNKSISEQTID